MVGAAYSRVEFGQAPRILRTSQGSCNIKHRELIANITDGAFFAGSLQSFACNPGIAATFPWLSQEAAGWERYRFNSLRFNYLTRVSTTTAGSVIMAPDYDASDAPPVSEEILSSYQGSVEASLWKDISCGLSRAAMHADEREKFVRIGAIGANQDIRLYDVANMFVSTSGGETGLCGKFWVEYDVTLFTPQIPSGGFVSSGVLVSGNTLTEADPFGLAAVATGGVILSSAAGVLTVSNLVVGSEYLLVLEITGTVISGLTVDTSNVELKHTLFDGFPAAATSAAVILTFIAFTAAATLAITATATTVTSAVVVVSTLAPAPSV